MNEKELFKLKERIDSAKAKASELQGRRDLLMQQLRTYWGCNSLKQAETKSNQMATEIANLNAKLAAGIAKVEEQLKEVGQ